MVVGKEERFLSGHGVDTYGGVVIRLSSTVSYVVQVNEREEVSR